MAGRRSIWRWRSIARDHALRRAAQAGGRAGAAGFRPRHRPSGRQDLSPSDLPPLYLYADATKREAIVRAIEATAALRPCPPVPRGLGAALTALSTDRDVPAFVSTLAEFLGLPPDFVAQADRPDARYDLLTIAMRAAGLHEEEAVYVF